MAKRRGFCAGVFVQNRRLILMNCPIPINTRDHVLLGHGSGGRLSHQLIRDIFYPVFKNPLLEQDHDGCILPVESGKIAY